MLTWFDGRNGDTQIFHLVAELTPLFTAPTTAFVTMFKRVIATDSVMSDGLQVEKRGIVWIHDEEDVTACVSCRAERAFHAAKLKALLARWLHSGLSKLPLAASARKQTYDFMLSGPA